MTIARHYVMHAAEGKAAELPSAFTALVGALVGIPGFEGADLLRDVDEPARFIFIEKWSSVEAHKEGGSLLPKEAIAPLMASLAGRPEGAYLTYLPVT